MMTDEQLAEICRTMKRVRETMAILAALRPPEPEPPRVAWASDSGTPYGGTK